MSSTREVGVPRSPERGPVFILSAARSGSTLLRYMLDAHPNLACPPETFVAPALAQMMGTQSVLLGHATHTQSEEFKAALSDLADSLFATYATQQGKRRWCDKSLQSIDFADLLADIFPTAHFLCLYRECTDVIMSAIDACKWGFAGYGFEPYVARRPANFVAALGEYWADRVELALAFEQKHPDRSLRVTYEALVTRLRPTLKEILTFIDEAWSEQVCDSEYVFRERPLDGPGDYKIAYAHTVATTSVGRGWQVPRDRFPDALRNRVNKALLELGYQSLDTSGPTTNESSCSDGNALQIEDLFFGRLAARLADASYSPISSTASGASMGKRRVIAAYIRDVGQWFTLDLTDRRVFFGERECTISVITDCTTLLAVANGELNPGSAFRAGRIGLTAPLHGDPREVHQMLHDFFRVISPSPAACPSSTSY